MCTIRKMLCLTLSLAAVSFVSCAADLTRIRTYADGLYEDVAAADWFSVDVQDCYEYGLMQGNGDGTFSPNAPVSVAEAVTMASRVSAALQKKKINTASDGEWYAPYTAYAENNGLYEVGAFDDYDRPAKRHEVASLLAAALPEERFAPINTVEKVPDVPTDAPYHDALLMLYRAGVVTGADDAGRFFPNAEVTRAEAAAMFCRAVLPDRRITRGYGPVNDTRDDAYVLVNNYTDGGSLGMDGYKEGIASGWVLDNRGGAPRTSINEGYTSISDISAEYGTAMIREFNPFDTGLVKLETRLVISRNNEGAYIEYRNTDGAPVYRLEISDNGWQYVNADGSRTRVYDIHDETSFVFEITVDLDKGISQTTVNYTDCGTRQLASENGSLASFRYGTDEPSKAVIACTNMNIVVNYAVHDDFEWDSGVTVLGYTGHGYTASGTLNVEPDGYAETSFDGVTGIVMASAEFNLPHGEDSEYTLYDGDTAVVTLSSSNGDFYVNGTVLYEDFVPNLWYDFRAETDINNKTVRVKLNGIDRAELTLLCDVEKIDRVSVHNAGSGTVKYDNMKVYEYIEHADYVPEPIVPRGEEKYNVGLNICSLWTNGCHFGWSCVTPFDDLTPVLGYYDEGVPETADWEIKYMVEHGIDFQAFCWYPGESDAPIKYTRQGSQLRWGYKNAKYSDKMKYCLIWEAANASRPKGMDAWKNYYVPYLIEHYFKDPRYMTIDNRPLLYVFGAANLANGVSSGGFGSRAAVKEAFAYLNDELAKIGLGKVIAVASHAASSPSLKDMGYTATAAYNWGTSGYQLSVNQSANISRAADKSCFTIPTISVGFNNVPWTGERHPLMTVEDYRKANEWMRDDFGPSNADGGENWQKNLYHLSTWNEYGEGTCIMPMRGGDGFGYLDVLREVFTDEQADPTLDIVPTENQLRRITHRYPQHQRLLRKEGYVTVSDGDRKMVINDQAFNLQLPIQTSPNGETLVTYDPAVGMEFRLNAFHTWNKDEGTLKLEMNHHTVVYTVGSGLYTLDGTEKPLGFTLDTLDGLPLIPIKMLCEDVGYTYEKVGKVPYIETPEAEFFRQIGERVPEQWEFSLNGDTEGWTSSLMSLLVADGYMTATSVNGSTDPTISMKGITFSAKKYKQLAVRIRYDYTPRTSGGKEIPESLTVYFATDYDSKLNEAKTLRIPLEGHTTNGEWREYVLDIDNELWDGAVNQLRFDPFNAVGTCDIDYIRFLRDENYDEEADKGIKNGDAEGAICKFTSHNGSISITADPEDPTNRCYLTISKDGSKQWLYSEQKVVYAPNTTYKVEYDIHIAALGTAMLPDDDAAGHTILCNFKYLDTAGTVDHVVHRTNLAKKDGWTHVSFTYTTGNTIDRGKDEFSIYADPTPDGKTVGYYFDNVTLTAIN